MKKLFLFIGLAAIMASCSEKGGDVMTVADFQKDAATLVGKEVKVSGTVSSICCGKKIVLTEGETCVKAIAVDDMEEIDASIKESKVIVTGIVKEKVIDEDYINKIEQECKEKCGVAEEEEVVEDTTEVAEGEEVIEEEMSAEETDETTEVSEDIEEASIEGEGSEEAEKKCPHHKEKVSGECPHAKDHKECDHAKEHKGCAHAKEHKGCAHAKEGHEKGCCAHAKKIEHYRAELKESGEDKIVKYYIELTKYEVEGAVEEEAEHTEEEHGHDH